MRYSNRVIAGMLVLALGWCGSTHAEQNKTPPGKPVEVQFPADTSYGAVEIIPANADMTMMALLGSKFANAMGRIVLPPNMKYILRLNWSGAKHPEVIAKLPPMAFSVLKILQLEADDSIMPAVAKLTGLERLEICDTDITDKGIEQVKSLKNLRYLHLLEGSFTGEFLAHLPPMPNLAVFRCTTCQLKTKYLDEYSGTLPALKRLRLSATALKNDDLLFLRKFPSLDELDLNGNRTLGDGSIKYLCQCKEIDYLTLHDTAVSPQGVKQLASVKIKFLTVPKRFTPREVSMLRQAMPHTMIVADGATIAPYAEKIFAPLH
jgi:hypothetical protein